MIGPTLPRRAERKLDPAPIPAKAGVGNDRTTRGLNRRHTTISRRNAPSRRVSFVKGADANKYPPSSAIGTPPRANQPTTRQFSSRRLNQTRLPFPKSCAMVRIGTADRIPKNAISTGSSKAAPPNPVTAAKVEAINDTKSRIGHVRMWGKGPQSVESFVF